MPSRGESKKCGVPLDSIACHRNAIAGIMDLPGEEVWVNFFGDILYQNFDPTKGDIIKLKCLDSLGGGNASHVMTSSLECGQGFTRISIIYFIAHHIIEYVRDIDGASSANEMD